MVTKRKQAFDLAPEDDYSDLISVTPINGHGGKREGSGKKSKAVQDATKDSHVEFNKARAKNEAYKANLAELDFKVKSGEYLPRIEIQQATATAYATISQTLRSIPDNLERRLGISPEVAEAVGAMIDDCMNDLAADLEKMHTENAA